MREKTKGQSGSESVRSAAIAFVAALVAATAWATALILLAP